MDGIFIHIHRKNQLQYVYRQCHVMSSRPTLRIMGSEKTDGSEIPFTPAKNTSTSSQPLYNYSRVTRDS